MKQLSVLATLLLLSTTVQANIASDVCTQAHEVKYQHLTNSAIAGTADLALSIQALDKSSLVRSSAGDSKDSGVYTGYFLDDVMGEIKSTAPDKHAKIRNNLHQTNYYAATAEVVRELNQEGQLCTVKGKLISSQEAQSEISGLSLDESVKRTKITSYDDLVKKAAQKFIQKSQ